MKYNKKILITAGGTGGHVFPALTIANELRCDHEVLWVGGLYGIEKGIAHKNNIRFESIKILGLRGKGIVRLVMYPFIIIKAIIKALKIIVKEKPDIVIGFGGYATFPICFMGSILRIKTVIHEQNSVAGLTNKVLSFFVNTVLVAYKNVLPSKKTIYVGNPVRKAITEILDIETRYSQLDKKINLLVVGGSLGAKVINKIVPSINLQNINKITHQIGANDNKEEIIELYRKNNFFNVNVLQFIDDITYEYEQAHLIICRAGATTVSELTSFGIAAIFIPLLSAVDDHQTINVQQLVSIGAAIMLPQSELSVNALSHIINELTIEKCKIMAMKTKLLGFPDSTQKIVDIIKTNLIKSEKDV